MSLFFTKEQWGQLLSGMAEKVKENVTNSQPTPSETTTNPRSDVSVDTGRQVITIQPEGTSSTIEINYSESTEDDSSILTLEYPDGETFKVEVK